MIKILICFKLAIIIFLASSIVWFVDFNLTDIFKSCLVLFSGILITIIFNCSELVPSFSFKIKGSANKVPKLAAFLILPFLLIIPLTFQSSLMNLFMSWAQLLRSFYSFGSIFSDNGLVLFYLFLELLIAGSYLLIVVILTQVIFKIIVDYFFIEEDKNFTSEQIQQFKNVLQEHNRPAP